MPSWSEEWDGGNNAFYYWCYRGRTNTTIFWDGNPFCKIVSHLLWMETQDQVSCLFVILIPCQFSLAGVCMPTSLSFLLLSQQLTCKLRGGKIQNYAAPRAPLLSPLSGEVESQERRRRNRSCKKWGRVDGPSFVCRAGKESYFTSQWLSTLLTPTLRST